jgi:hypothetical protein
MRGEIERFSTGWSQVNIRFRRDELDKLIDALRQLKTDETHMHLRSTFEASEPGIADIEISLQGPDEKDNLSLE